MRSLRGGAFAPKPREKSHSKRWSFTKITKKMVLVFIALFVCISATHILNHYKTFINQAAAGFSEISSDFSKMTGLVVKEVIVEGRAKTNKTDLLAALQISEGDSILRININKIRERINKLPWIKSVRVERHFPNKISLSLVERVPLARWQKNRQLSLIDTQGDIIPRVDLARFLHLPIIIGENAPKLARQILKILSKEPHLFRRVRSVTLVSDRRWDVRLDNQIDVHLPEKNPQKAWAHLATVEHGHSILGSEVQGIDMRLENQLIIKLEKRKTSPTKTPGRTT